MSEIIILAVCFHVKDAVLSIMLARICYCFGLHRSEASIVQRRVKDNGQY